MKDYHKKKQAKEWVFQEEPSGDLFKAQERKLPKPSAKEDPYLSRHQSPKKASKTFTIIAQTKKKNRLSSAENPIKTRF